MQTETLTAAVHNSCPDLDAQRVAQCTLITLDALGEHLSTETGDRVASGLPDDAAGALRSGSRRADTTGESVKIGVFLDKVRTRTELPPEQADSLTYAVAITLAHMLDESRVQLLRDRLPSELDRLFRD
ncbi:DUF2267 domain-containing protein [Salinisphaera hydrothermalis]|uniref:DUF2267 domain-containing protein n=1 Tax=Salinisphaera hydrothermalis (strain C41B8) TaxID=1304275 RepID=A0A084IRN6_SALHC|nr:DUF2267 domain-containing protein [Salinisphaera hydrothermalis]KEZ79370.1 hypothetical protein C41B8_01435 [Salinisphaera hydrothermalis C41B8]